MLRPSIINVNFTPGPSINLHVLQQHREYLLPWSLFCRCRSGWYFNTFATGYFISIWIFWFLMKNIFTSVFIFAVVFVNYLSVFLLGSLSPSCWFIGSFYSNPLSWIVPVFFIVCLLLRLVYGVCFFSQRSGRQLEEGLVECRCWVSRSCVGPEVLPFSHAPRHCCSCWSWTTR